MSLPEQDEETVRFCIKEEREGVVAPTGIVCTGAFSPQLLRSGTSIFEPLIQKIISDDAKFGFLSRT